MICIENLIKSFDKKKILKNLHLQIPQGQRVALVGQNGSGKTTLIRCLLGLYNYEGEVSVLNLDIKNHREEALKQIAFVPQHPPALKNTVSELLSLTSYLCNINIDDVAKICHDLGLNLEQCSKTPFKALSGGMKQKLLIALAFARKPALLVMDEPSTNLDPKARTVFFDLLTTLPKETSMLLTSHRVDELAGIVTRVIEMDNGEIIIDDILETVRTNAPIQKKLCTITFKNIHPSFKKILQSWSFTTTDPLELIWEGRISTVDSFRFFATLTRWSGSIESFQFKNDINKEA